jgi:hypothetical protein
LASECGGGFLHLLGLCCGFIKANLKIETVITASMDREVQHCLSGPLALSRGMPNPLKDAYPFPR